MQILGLFQYLGGLASYLEKIYSKIDKGSKIYYFNWSSALEMTSVIFIWVVQFWVFLTIKMGITPHFFSTAH